MPPLFCLCLVITCSKSAKADEKFPDCFVASLLAMTDERTRNGISYSWVWVNNDMSKNLHIS